jgi:acyl-coenzyme A synthetase/AMP-(fatty) acid ligase
LQYNYFDRDPERLLFVTADRQVTGAQFLGHVYRVADALPDRKYAINFCDSRYDFAVAFFAALLRGQSNLLLPGRGPEFLAAASTDLTDAYVLSSRISGAASLQEFDMGSVARDGADSHTVPVLPGDQAATTVYTSGTTGLSCAITKTVSNLARGAEINARVLNEAIGTSSGYLVATVPPWHMYGLEWSVLAPMFSDHAVFSGATLFPQDISDALGRCAAPSCLISTPHHLRALVRSSIDHLHINTVLCATAPLSESLEASVVNRVADDVVEIYGCTEMGSMASRSHGSRFTFFPELSHTETDGVVRVSAPHIPDVLTLPDVLDFFADGSFSITGRDTDMVKVAGKRASLAELNRCLLEIQGVEDGVLLQRPEDDRLAAVLVLRDVDAKSVVAQLGTAVERSFLPRLVRVIQELPRNEAGKLKRASLLALFEDQDELA